MARSPFNFAPRAPPRASPTTGIRGFWRRWCVGHTCLSPRRYGMMRSGYEVYTYRSTRTRALVFWPRICTADLILCRGSLPESRFARLKRVCEDGQRANDSLAAHWIEQLGERDFGTHADRQILRRTEGGIGGNSNRTDRQVRFWSPWTKEVGKRPKRLQNTIMLNLLPSWDGTNCWSCEDEAVLWDTFKCVLDAKLPPPVQDNMLMIQPWENNLVVTGATNPYQKKVLRSYGCLYNRSIGAFLLDQTQEAALRNALEVKDIPVITREHSTLANPQCGKTVPPGVMSNFARPRQRWNPSSFRQLSSLAHDNRATASLPVSRSDRVWAIKTADLLDVEYPSEFDLSKDRSEAGAERARVISRAKLLQAYFQAPAEGGDLSRFTYWNSPGHGEDTLVIMQAQVGDIYSVQFHAWPGDSVDKNAKLLTLQLGVRYWSVETGEDLTEKHSAWGRREVSRLKPSTSAV